MILKILASKISSTLDTFIDQAQANISNEDLSLETSTLHKNYLLNFVTRKSILRASLRLIFINLSVGIFSMMMLVALPRIPSFSLGPGFLTSKIKIWFWVLWWTRQPHSMLVQWLKFQPFSLAWHSMLVIYEMSNLSIALKWYKKEFSGSFHIAKARAIALSSTVCHISTARERCNLFISDVCTVTHCIICFCHTLYTSNILSFLGRLECFYLFCYPCNLINR